MEQDLAALSDDALTELARSLAGEERQLSTRRASLHRRIDFVRTGGGDYTDAAGDQLATLEEEERSLSRERLDLHTRIERVRAETQRRESARRAAEHASA